jgi:hypothetical protein
MMLSKHHLSKPEVLPVQGILPVAVFGVVGRSSGV